MYISKCNLSLIFLKDFLEKDFPCNVCREIEHNKRIENSLIWTCFLSPTLKIKLALYFMRSSCKDSIYVWMLIETTHHSKDIIVISRFMCGYHLLWTIIAWYIIYSHGFKTYSHSRSITFYKYKRYHSSPLHLGLYGFWPTTHPLIWVWCPYWPRVRKIFNYAHF